VEPRVGGRYTIVSGLFGRREASIEHFEPGTRLKLLYESNPDWPPLSESALLEDFIIDDRKGLRMLRVMGSGLPAGEEWAKVVARLRTGWALAFARLQMKLREGVLGEPAA
jgi:hypothetical protein